MSAMEEASTIRYHQHLIIGVTTFVEGIGIMAYALRLLARRLSRSKLWYDDYVMGIGLTFYVLQLSYVSTLPIVKISVLLFYHRIFPQQRFQYALYGMGTVLTLFLFSNWFAVALQCLPIHSFWQPEVPHHCFNQVTYYIAQGSFNFVSDLFVVLMPIPILWHLHLPISRRVGLVFVFLLGGFACAVSLCRIVSLREVQPDDITWTNVGPGLWSAAEAEALVMSANLPLMSPVVQHLRGYYRTICGRVSKGEEKSSSILESFAMESENKYKYSKNVASADSARNQGSTIATTAEEVVDKGRTFADFEMQDSRIFVEIDLEQQVTSL